MISIQGVTLYVGIATELLGILDRADLQDIGTS